MKILHILQGFSLGGASRSVVAIAKDATQHKLDQVHCAISLTPAHPQAVKLAEMAGLQVIEAPSLETIYREITQADIVHIHFWNTPELYELLQLNLPPMRLLVWLKVVGDRSPHIVTSELVNYADILLATTPYSLEIPAIKSRSDLFTNNQIGVVPGIADFSRLESLNNRRHEGFNVGYIGTVDFSKLYQNYIPMSAGVQVPNIRFIVCGGGIENSLKQQAASLGVAEKFEFRGYVEDIKSVLEILDVFGYPLVEDTYATSEKSLQEAMYAGIPPVVFPHGGIKGLVINNQTGLVVNSEQEYQQAIAYLYHHPQERLRLGNNARNYAKQYFNPQVSIDKIHETYKQLMEFPKRERRLTTGNPQTGAALFVQSLGDIDPRFKVSLTSNHLSEQLESDRHISRASPGLCNPGGGGLFHYRNCYPQDGYLRFWSALVLQTQGRHQEAVNEFYQAWQNGCNIWRVLWYLANSAEQMGNHNLAQQAINRVLELIPNFTPAADMKHRINSLSTPATKSSVNHAQLDLQRQFWNVNSIQEAMFARVLTYPGIEKLSPQERQQVWEQSIDRTTQQILQGIPSQLHWKVLEIGCGVGRLVKPLRERFNRVDGVDISANMIEFAKQYLADGQSNGELYVNSGSDLQDLPGEFYDLVYSTIVFQHIRSLSVVKSYFREIFRVLKPGGYFRIQVHDRSAENLGDFDEEGAENQQYYLYGNAYNDRQLRDLLIAAGFNLVSLECVKPWIWSTVQRPQTRLTYPQVSAIISTYNSANFLRGCLQDLVNQTLYDKQQLEIIVIDSNSQENEAEIVADFQAKYTQIIYHRTEHRETLYAAWNRAIELAKGEYITNANTDDRHRFDALELMANYLDQHSDVAVVYGDQLITHNPNETFENTQANQRWNWPEFSYQELERRCCLGSQPMWRKSLHQKYGNFNPEFKVAGDYEFWLRIGKTENIAKIPEILGLYFDNQDGLENKTPTTYTETQKICQQYGITNIPRTISKPVSVYPEEIKPLKSPRKFHILVYTDEPRVYGVGQYNHSILTQLIQSGYHVSCVQSRESHYLLDQQKQLGIQHFWLDYDSVKDFQKTLTDQTTAETIFTKANPDLILFSDCCPLSNLAAKQVAMRLKIPFVITENFVAPYLAQRFQSYLGQLADIYQHSQEIIAVSQENLQQLWELFQLPKPRGRVIYYGRPRQYFSLVNPTTRDRIRQQLGIPPNAIVCFTSARLESIKGYQYQLQAIQQLKNTPIWCQLYFLWTGEGSWEHKLQTEIKKLGVTDQVKLLGCRHDIPDLLDASDIFILPSELEGMPLSVMEAMAKGLPIIASAVSGIPEELGNTGKLLSDPKINASATITELVETLEQWVANPHLRYNIGQACKQRAEQMFTEQQMLTKTIEVIKTALPTNLPLISVIIPCYQQAEFLPEAVASVVAQTYPNWEIIIVNDGSPDQTSQVAQHLIQIFANHKISLIATDNKGCASARNAGINQAKGEYILPLDADDKLSSSAIASLVEVALSKSHDCVIFGSYEIFGTEQRKIVTADQYSLENLKQYNMLVCTSLYSKNVYKLTNGYKEEIKESGYEDWEFWLNCHQHNIPFYGIRETVLYYRRHPRSRVVQSFQNRDYYKAQVMSYYPDLFDAKPQPVELILNASGDLNLQNFADYVQKYQQNPHDELALDNLRNARQAVADMWLKLETEQLPKAYQENLGQAHKSLLNSGIKNEIFRDDERLYFQEIKSYLSQGFKQPKTFQYLLAGMLYGRADQLMLTFEESLIPTWLAEDYFRFLFDVPPLFQEIGDADNYSRYRIRLLDFVRERLQQQPDYPLWQKLTTMLLERGNFIPNYFADFNLKPLFCSRAELFHLFLQSRDFQLDYSFPEPPSDRQKIRLGILNDHLNPQTETYLTLPAFEYLNREQFEIILYVTQANNHPLEQYCRSRADRLVRLPDDKLEQAATIRADNLDILLFGTNVTAITKPVTLLALHRLARVQATLFSSPVTTGMRYIDYYISGHLSEGAEAPNFYRENLAVLNGTGFCFNYYAIAPQPATVKPHRSQWGANDQTIVFMSGANFYKIIPEQGETWVKILAQVPNSILVLYPFAPSWSNNYASSQFIRRMHATLSKYGVAEKRLVLIKTLPSRTDVKACLEQGDIYLDSYPHSGSNSLVDPLEVGLPVVVRDGDTLRSKHGAAMMRSLGIPDLITDDESSYISLAVTLANTPELLQLKRQAIQQKMAANPEFLDSRAYGAKMGALLTQIFQNYQSKHQVIDLDNPQKQQRFLSELVDQVNLYELDPTNTMVVNKLHTIRRGMVEYWLRQPAEQLETLYQQQIGKGYQILLNRGLKKEPLNDEEKALVNHWTKTAMGLTEPHAINCLMAVMLYSQPGKMLVRDAVNRLPAWLLPDYQRVFENADAIAQIKQTLATTKTQSTPVNSPQVTPTVTAVDVSTFVNRLIGCVKLFKIDPTDTNITVELRQLRWQFAQFWLNLPEHKLEEMYQSPLGDGYRSLLNSRLQNEMLTQHEWDFLQQVGTYLRQGLDTPRSLNYLIAAMLYYRPEQLQIQDLSRLPSYLQRDYQNWQNPLSS
ncbi:glycosyltransferase [Limnospira indica]|uniref:glycosyltransferase n=1 Tax=Limnospira indica TaxID=147322 RepID=UPI00061AC64E|nr:glycosyltransferase [Limnospira indica]QNH57127.1 MAG: glycosyltransferase [Limnospira indica BM01]